MTIFNIIIGFFILLVISKTLSYNYYEELICYRERKQYNDLLQAFGERGEISSKVPKKRYITIGDRTYYRRVYNNSIETMMSLTEIVQTNNCFDNLTNSNDWNQSIDLDICIDTEAAFEMLKLKATQPHHLNSETFQWLSNTSIKSLIMEYSRIESVEKCTLYSVRNTLKDLDLAEANISYTNLVSLMKSFNINSTESVSALKILSLARLGLKTVPYEALKPVQFSLVALSLYGNNFESTFTKNPIIQTDNFTSSNVYEENNESEYLDELEINYLTWSTRNSYKRIKSSWADFPPMPALNELDLRNCSIHVVEEGSFENLGNLKKLHISMNHIVTVANYAFSGLINLSFLDLSLNSFKPGIEKSYTGLLLDSNSFTGLHSLTTMNFSYTFIRQGSIQYLNKLPLNLVVLNFCGTSLTELEDGVFEKLSNLKILDLSCNVALGSTVTTETFKGLNSLHTLYMSKSSFKNFKALQELTSLRYLDVGNNNINNFFQSMANFPLLEYLDVSENYVTSWSNGRAFENNPKLTQVNLHDNMLALMSEDMLKDFKSLTYLTLANNNFVCNCQLNEFMEYLKSKNNDSNENFPILIDYRSNGTTYVCTDTSLSKTFQFEDTDDYCIQEYQIIWLSTIQHAVYIGLLVIVCSASIGGLIYWKWWYIKYIAVLIKNATVLSMINVENCEDRIYIYDIFVSYSDKDRKWVIEELIANIENPDTNLSICLHERDFQVGVGILENIITGMDQSRTILLIISKFFIKSQWCQFEMHLAQHRLLETCREELVLVLLEKIPKIKRPKTLHYLMMVKTYIVWPKNSEDIKAKKLFWKRLRKAITANKSKQSSVA